jgi:mannosyl-3-phosphoglycerate phosphatase
MPETPPWLLFSDLDGTLLDHASYDYAPALPALDRLARAGVPVVLASSKTLAEMARYQTVLGLSAPLIVETGAAVCLPPSAQGLAPTGRTASGAGGLAGQWRPTGGYRVLRLGPSYARIRAHLEALRRDVGYAFRGFADLDAAQVAALTGLAPRDAARARQRLCSEPLIWEDTSAALERFRGALAARGLRLIRGGRFLHVLGRRADKGRAMAVVVDLYRRAGDPGAPRSVALGDSPNDLDMLQRADLAVVVRNHRVPRLTVPGRSDVRRTRAEGPRGWNEAVLAFLDGPLAPPMPQD